MNATAVCPNGNELNADLSGLSTFAVYLIAFTDAAVNKLAIPNIMVLSLKLCLPYSAKIQHIYTCGRNILCNTSSIVNLVGLWVITT